MLTIFTIVTDECGSLIAIDAEGTEIARVHIDEVDSTLPDHKRAMRHMELVCRTAAIEVNADGGY